MAAILPFLPALISAAGSIGGALLSRQGNKETKIQKQQRTLVDQLLASLKGNGPYSNLFEANEEDFNRTFRDPAIARFKNQTAPQIQQGYIAQGQQRSTGLEDTLARAGVDMDQLLNQHFAQFQQGAQNRQTSALSSILSQGAGAGPGQSIGQAAAQGGAGYLSGSGFKDDIGGIIQSIQDSRYNAPYNEPIQDTFLPPRKGFEKDPQVYNPSTGVQR